jgi:RNA polymerase sigma-70 factor (ECF subfamily)
MMDDSTAIRNCQSGNLEAFRHLVERYQGQAIGHAIAILGNREDALDAIQDAFLDAFRVLRKFDVECRFYPWFYVILRNRCFKLAAGRKRESLGNSEQTEILAATPSLRPEETLLLEQMMLELKPEDRELITLKHLDGLSYDELAERLDVPLGTIMSRLYHARKKLRDKLARHSFTGFSEG